MARPILVKSVCLTNSDLLEVEDDALGSSVPCDMIGAFYLSGLSLDYLGEATGGLIDEYAFYLPTRIYLRRSLEQRSSTGDARSISYLFIASSMIVAQTDSEYLSKERGAIYQAYFLSEYLKSNASALTKEDGPEKELRAGIVLNALTQLAKTGGFTTVLEATCFVKFDLPDLEVMAIRESSNYRSCVNGG